MEFVYANSDSMVSWGPTGSTVLIRPNQIWFADDPFVLARPDLFSATPLVAHSTTGRLAPDPTPVSAAVRTGRGRRG